MRVAGLAGTLLLLLVAGCADPGPASSTPGRVAARVLSVVDGDTIRVSIDGRTATVRYIGMDTPETVAPGRPVQPGGPEATAANKRLVEGRMVTLEKDVSETDSFGRLLRYVYVSDATGEHMVNAELVRLGFARTATYPPDVRSAALFLDLERQARAASAGIWAGAGTATPAAPRGTGTGNRYDCADFASQAQAQAVLRADPRDPNRLDGGDQNGIACESNPAPRDLVPVPRN